MENSSSIAEEKRKAALFPNRVARVIFSVAAAIVLIAFGVILSGGSSGRGVFWDNLHWTCSFGAAAWLAWIGVLTASPGDRAPRRWFAWGLTANAIGQILWNIQAFWGPPPAPNITDAIFLTVGPFFITGFISSFRRHAEARQMRGVLLDAAALSVAVSSVVLALYLPYQLSVSRLLIYISAGYPVTLLSAACVGIVVVLAMKSSCDRRWLLFWVALLAYGVVWMQWNSLVLSEGLRDGAVVNLAFSIVVMAMGLGAMIWHVGDPPGLKWNRFCEVLMSMLPLFLVMIAVGIIALAKTQRPGLESVQYAIVAGALLVIVLAMVRQSVALSERNRLLAAERRSKENEEIYWILFETAQDAILILEEGKFVDCNESALRLFRCDKDRILNRSSEELSPEVQPDGQLSSAKGQVKSLAAYEGRAQLFEWRFKRADGSEFEADVSLNRIEMQGGMLLLALVRDVTLQKQSQEAIRMSDQKFSSAFEHAAIGMALVGIDGQWLKVNRTLREILGYPWVELKDKTFQEITHPDDLEADMERVRELLDGKIQSYQMEKRYFHKDGRVVPVLLSVSLVRDGSGKPLHFISQIQDITQRKQLEQQFLQAQKMEAMGTLAGGIAHDFNNILAAMNGYTELARMEAHNLPVACKYLDSVLQAGTRAAELVRQILAFSRHQGSLRVPLKLDEVVRDALKLLRATIPSTIEFKVSLAADLPPVLADATQIHQVLMNLGTNAWHSMGDRPGQLDIVLERYEVDRLMAEAQIHLQPGSYLRLEVKDTGKGMEPAVVSRIFEPFFTTKAPGQGTGLGLSVVHGIMQGHEGAIHVYSQQGEGTVFHLFFPVYLQEIVKAPVESTPAPSGNGERILFVDDEPALVELGKKVLELLGYRVKSFSSVIEAMAEFRARPEEYDLVVTDQSMPKMSGIEFSRQLLEIKKDLPIILATGYASSLTVDRVREIGIRDLLLKPLCLQSLGTAVHEVLSQKK